MKFHTHGLTQSRTKKGKNEGFAWWLTECEGSPWEMVANVSTKSYGQLGNKRSSILLSLNEEKLGRQLYVPLQGSTWATASFIKMPLSFLDPSFWMKSLGVSRGQMEKGEVTATRIERTLYASGGKATLLEAQERTPENPRSLWGRERKAHKNKKQHPHST